MARKRNVIWRLPADHKILAIQEDGVRHILRHIVTDVGQGNEDGVLIVKLTVIIVILESIALIVNNGHRTVLPDNFQLHSLKSSVYLYCLD